MPKTISLTKFGLFNLLLATIYIVLKYDIILALYIFSNISLLILALFDLPFLEKKYKASFLKHQKKITLIAITAGGSTLALITGLFAMDAIYFFLANVTVTVLLSARMFLHATARTIYRTLNKNARIAVIGYNSMSAEFVEQLKKKPKYSFEGFFDKYDPHSSFMKRPDYLGSVEYCLEVAKQKKVTDLYIASATPHAHEFEAFALKAESYCIRVSFVDTQETALADLYKSHVINGVSVMGRYNEPLRHLSNKIIKRAFDIFLSSIILIFILSWLIPLIGLLIKLESKGPVFFKQLRSGRDDNAFPCYKFRSMKKNAESDLKQATKNDARVTLIGSFLRKTSIDELPQFINVFKGDMSIVGPRPHMLLHTQQYSKQVKNYMARLYLKPGITGWAQANGYRGEISDIDLMKKRIEHDIWYLEHWTVWLDIKILWLTFVSVLRRKGNAY